MSYEDSRVDAAANGRRASRTARGNCSSIFASRRMTSCSAPESSRGTTSVDLGFGVYEFPDRFFPEVFTDCCSLRVMLLIVLICLPRNLSLHLSADFSF
jgi:hypothetical protein